MLIQTSHLSRHYQRGRHTIRAIDDVALHISAGDFVALVGASGSGKSTLLNLLAGLDSPTGGQVDIDGCTLGSLSRRELARYRASKIGIIFQSFNLLAHQSALKNVELALYFDGTARRQRQRMAQTMLEKVGLGDRLTHRPADLSGGEQQRVAIARALVKRPRILFADEPTGNLDRQNSRQVIDYLAELNREGLTVVLVTHDIDMAKTAVHRIIHMDYGHIEGETRLVEGRGSGR